MATLYPSQIDTTTQLPQPAGTNTLDNPDHAGAHTNMSLAVIAIENTVGTTAGTNLFKNFNAGDFPVRMNTGGTLQQAISGTINNAMISGWDGWESEQLVWSSVGTDTKTGTIAIAADRTALYQTGMRIKMTVGGSTQYGIISSVGAFSGGSTTFTVYSGTYVFGTTAITNPFYSPNKTPFGFNTDPANWQESFTDTSAQVQNSPVQNTWYNIGTYSLTIPIGKWRVYFNINCVSNKAAGPNSGMNVTLSTGTASQSDADLTTGFLIAGTPSTIGNNLFAEKYISLASKTIYYLNGQASYAAQDSIQFRGDLAKSRILAVSSLL